MTSSLRHGAKASGLVAFRCWATMWHPQEGRLVVNPAEAEQVRGMFSGCAACSTMTEGLRSVRARGCTAKQWTSERGKQHGGQPLSMSTLEVLTKVLYRGDISHKGTVYPGEHEAIVSNAVHSEE